MLKVFCGNCYKISPEKKGSDNYNVGSLEHFYGLWHPFSSVPMPGCQPGFPSSGHWAHQPQFISQSSTAFGLSYVPSGYVIMQYPLPWMLFRIFFNQEKLLWLHLFLVQAPFSSGSLTWISSRAKDPSLLLPQEPAGNAVLQPLTLCCTICAGVCLLCQTQFHRGRTIFHSFLYP